VTIYLFNRCYDPSSDQFLSIDPALASTGQAYAFVNDNPLNSADALGLRPVVGNANQIRSETLQIRQALVAAVKKLAFSGSTSRSKSVTMGIVGGSVTITVSASVSTSIPRAPVTATVGSDGTVTIGSVGVSTNSISASVGDATVSWSGDSLTASYGRTIDYNGSTLTTSLSATYTPSGGPGFEMGTVWQVLPWSLPWVKWASK
jgi:hypothetical protein